MSSYLRLVAIALALCLVLVACEEDPSSSPKEPSASSSPTAEEFTANEDATSMTALPPEEPSTPIPSADPAAFLWPSTLKLQPDGTAKLAVWVNPGEYGISSGEVLIFFPHNTCQASNLQPGALLGPDPLVGLQQTDNSAGVVRFAAARIGPTTAPSAPGFIATATLLCSPESLPDEAAIGLEVSLADSEFETIPLATIQGGKLVGE